jgi:V/A-type H+/Na+-transporting ATPase subunit E
MNDKLQELTSKIYQEGFEKGKKDADEIVGKAKSEAEALVKDAKKEAARIVEDARKEAEELKKNVQSELALSSRQAINALKQQLSELVSQKGVDEALGKAFDDKEFISKIILAIAGNWEKIDKSGGNVSLLLPEKDRGKLDDFLQGKVAGQLKAGLDIDYDEGVKSGFRIGPADGHFRISFTEDDFRNFFIQYLRPRTRKILFGE